MTRVRRLQHTSVPMPPGGNDDARRFYGEVLAMEEKQPPTSLNRLGLVWFRAGEDEVHLFTEESFGANSAQQHLCLEVEDIGWYRKRLTARGVPIEETIEIPGRPRFFVRDPFGNLIEITQITGEYT